MNRHCPAVVLLHSIILLPQVTGAGTAAEPSYTASCQHSTFLIVAGGVRLMGVYGCCLLKIAGREAKYCHSYFLVILGLV